LSLEQGIKNLQDITEPIGVLQERLSRENLILAQKEEFSTIREECLKSSEFNYIQEDTGEEFRLIHDLLFIKHKQTFKIYVPHSMKGLLLSYTHLLGHWGVNKTLANLEGYYFKHMYTTVKRFINSCYSCFLQNSSSKKNKLGLYPIPEEPFEEISMDLCENLNKVGGYSHLLIAQDVLTDYIIIVPLKSKTNAEIRRATMYNILQYFNVKRVHTDNGPGFRNNDYLRFLAALKITMIDSSAQNPQARGKAERAVGLVKTTLKKLLATASSNTLNWEYLPFLVSKIMNHTIITRLGCTPATLIFGNTELSKTFLSIENTVPGHHLIKNNKVQIEKLTETVQNLCHEAKLALEQEKTKQTESKNTNRIAKRFNVNDIVFVLDRYNLPGNSRPLKTKYYASPCVVIKALETTSLIQRIADGFRALYSNDHIKKYHGTDPLFNDLPQTVRKILLNDFEHLISDDFLELARIDPFNYDMHMLSNSVSNIDTVGSSSPDKGEEGPSSLVPINNVNHAILPGDVFTGRPDHPDPDLTTVPTHDIMSEPSPASKGTVAPGLLQSPAHSPVLSPSHSPVSHVASDSLVVQNEDLKDESDSESDNDETNTKLKKSVRFES